MDQIKTGQFIAELRKEKSLTQKQLADMLGISDRAISKWENGRGFPDVSLLLPLCEVLGISVNELLSGETLPEQQYKEKAEENLMAVLNNSNFTLKEKISFYKKKWLKDHKSLIVLSVLFWLGVTTGMGFLTNAVLPRSVAVMVTGFFGGFLSTALYLVLYNRMMAYVEKNAYDGTGK